MSQLQQQPVLSLNRFTPLTHDNDTASTSSSFKSLALIHTPKQDNLTSVSQTNNVTNNILIHLEQPSQASDISTPF